MTARAAAAGYIRITSERLKSASAAARLSPVANALIGWIVNELATKSVELSDAQRTASNVLTRSAAVLAQQNALIANLAAAQSGSSVRASTGQVIPAQGGYNEGFGGLVQTAMVTFNYGSSSPGDLAQALLSLAGLEPVAMRAIAAAQPTVASVQTELRLCEAICAFVRRAALVQSILAGIKVAPSHQPDASLTRARLLQQLDQEIALAANRPELYAALRGMRTAVVRFVAWYSQGGGGAVRVPYASTGKPLAATAADMYAAGSTVDRDRELMQFNNVDHPLFGPAELDALHSNAMLIFTSVK